MEPQPTTSADVGITTQSVTSIDLDASQLTVPPQTAWNIQEQQREHEGRSRLKALQWVYRQDSSRPAPGTFINSPPLDMRMRHNDEIVGLVDNILHQPSHLDTSDSKPSSALAIPAAALTARRDRGHPASADGSSFQDRLLDSSSAFQVLEPTSSFADRNPKYHDTGHHDEGRPPDTLDSDGWQASSSVLSDPQTRGVKEEHVPNPGRHQVHWAPTNPSETDTGSVTKKQPKRQNSRLTDDEQGTRRRRKRHRTGLKGRSPRTSPAVSGSTNSPRQAESRLPQTGTGRSRQQTQREPHSHPGPGSSSFHEQVEHDSDCRFSEENFIGADETCFFWLHDNRKYSGRNACRGRKIEISHIVTHAVDHHGLIRGKDIRYTNRGYLMSCQTHDPETKATGTCAKCKSLQDWRGGDFDDPAHHGMVLCLRCWCGFTKREMQAHLAEPLCSYMAEQPKSMKVYILYTTFCSKDDPPSAPPNFETPSHGRKTTKGRNRSAARDPQPKQEGRNQRTGQQSPKESANGGQFRSLQPTGKSNKPATSRGPSAPHLQVPSRNPTRPSQQVQRLPAQTSISLSSPSWRQPTVRNFESESILPSAENYRLMQMRQAMSQEARNLALSSLPMRQPSPHGQPFQAANMQRSLAQLQVPLRQSTQSVLPSSQQFNNQSLQQLVQSIQEVLPNQLGQHSSPQPGYQPTQSSSSGQAQWSSMQRSLVTNTQTLFDNNFMYTGDLQDPSMPRIQATTPIDDFDGILPLEMLHSQPTPSQATASQVPSTMGEPQPMPSPDMDEPKWLKDPDDDGLDDFFYQIGSNPALQASIGRQNAPVRQQTLRPQDSSPDGLIPFGQQTKIEQDSAYESIRQGNPELDGNLNTMYQPTELDNMEIEEDFSTELGKYFDIERACQSPDACQEAPFTSRGFF